MDARSISFSKGFLLLREVEQSTLSSRSPMIDQASRCMQRSLLPRKFPKGHSADSPLSLRHIMKKFSTVTSSFEHHYYNGRCHGEDTFGSLVDHSSMPQSPHSLSFRALVLMDSLVQLQHFQWRVASHVDDGFFQLSVLLSHCYTSYSLTAGTIVAPRKGI